MTYPRNAASPEPIAIGAVVQISDGAVQTSGCTVRIKPIGVAEADGGGTTSYSTDGIVQYVPTQAETNYTSFILIAKKTGCIPVAVTVVTSASATAGYVGTDQGKIANPTSTVNLSGTTIKAVTDAVTAGTVSDKTGYSLSVSGIAAIWDALTSGMLTVGSIGKRIVDYLTGDIYARLGSPAGASIAADIADLPTVSEFEARTIVAANYATAANLATVAGYLDTEIAAILADTDELQQAWADGGRLDLILDARASQASVDAVDDLIDTEVAAIKTKTDNLPASPAATGDIPTVTQIWTTVLTEAYRSTGATGSGAQLLYEILAGILDHSISGTTKTTRKIDGTTAKTYTLDSATTPTSITEAT